MEVFGDEPCLHLFRNILNFKFDEAFYLIFLFFLVWTSWYIFDVQKRTTGWRSVKKELLCWIFQR